MVWLCAGKIPEEKSTSYMQYAYLVLYLDRKLVDQWCAANTRRVAEGLRESLAEGNLGGNLRQLRLTRAWCQLAAGANDQASD